MHLRPLHYKLPYSSPSSLLSHPYLCFLVVDGGWLENVEWQESDRGSFSVLIQATCHCPLLPETVWRQGRGDEGEDEWKPQYVYLTFLHPSTHPHTTQLLLAVTSISVK